MKVHLSVIKKEEVRTIDGDDSYICRDWGVGGSGIEGIGSPI